MASDRMFQGEVLPPESQGVRVPVGTPLGLAILGAARFSAVRRVIEQYERALRAQEAAYLAEGAVATAMARREVAREQLKHLDAFRDEEAERIRHVIAAAKLRRRLELMELEDQVGEREARRAGANRGSTETVSDAEPKPNEFSAFMDDLRNLPEIAKAVAAAKAQIVTQAGGEERLSEAERAICEMFDTMLQSFMSKRAGEAAL